MGTNIYGYRHLWLPTFMGTDIYECRHLWVPTLMGTDISLTVGEERFGEKMLPLFFTVGTFRPLKNVAHPPDCTMS